jgi:hypothetical protein
MMDDNIMTETNSLEGTLTKMNKEFVFVLLFFVTCKDQLNTILRSLFNNSIINLVTRI